jgi:hypothetical protein
VSAKESDVEVFMRMDKDKKALVPTGSLVITYPDREVRKTIDIGHYDLQVKEYEEEPKMCKNCLQLGHTKKFCTNPEACLNCGESGHKANACDKTRCVHCESDAHKSKDKNCPTFIFFKKTLKYCKTYDVSYKYALKFATQTVMKYVEEKKQNVMPGTSQPTYAAMWKGTFSKQEKKTDVKETLREKKTAQESQKIVRQREATTKNSLEGIFKAILPAQRPQKRMNTERKTNGTKYTAQTRIHQHQKQTMMEEGNEGEEAANSIRQAFHLTPKQTHTQSTNPHFDALHSSSSEDDDDEEQRRLQNKRPKTSHENDTTNLPESATKLLGGPRRGAKSQTGNK